jgi:signal peptidase I
VKTWISRTWKENRAFLLFIVLMLAFRSSFADWNTVPTGSMKPTIVEGDRILVNKMAYDIRLPFTRISMFEVSDPARGDIVVFESQVSDKRLVKRVVGIPGDVVEMADNALLINGKRAVYRDVSSTPMTVDRTEDLFGTDHLIRVDSHGSRMATFGPVEVPADHYLALGDNRDNSADSRVIGFVPRSEIIGRSKTVVVSFDYENYYIPRSDRFLHTL